MTCPAFGPLGDSGVWGRAMQGALGPEGAQYTVIFAFQVLPTIIFIAALFAIRLQPMLTR